ncbi:hypothetical protein H310_13112 [Aphanomyces invadans]|uniref:Phosphodiesterase n=1 Tax=Aphanomyces invadans TaxID=157072 RepID=A0A024TGE9_9STRA|nr:hypothetical protein H310_13112 [Aphanomyces invadans]ETV92671.1 hypothetical protein H310_13112 [Aphanomyces invadans]|eukprot:XP_008878707.1 hypothetical protein H310_13112 [Aphanomyces invadans]
MSASPGAPGLRLPLLKSAEPVDNATTVAPLMRHTSLKSKMDGKGVVDDAFLWPAPPASRPDKMPHGLGRIHRPSMHGTGVLDDGPPGCATTPTAGKVPSSTMKVNQMMGSLEPLPPTSVLLPSLVDLASTATTISTMASAAKPVLPSLNSSTNHEHSNDKIDLEQRITKLKLDHFPIGHDHPQVAYDDAERYSDINVDEYMEYARTLDLGQLQAHHTNLYKLVRQYQGLFSVASAISVEMDSNGALARIVSGVHRVLPVERVVLLLVHRNSGVLCGTVAGVDVEMPIAAGIEGAVVAHGKAMIVEDAATDPRFDKTLDVATKFTTRNALCAPVTDPKGNIMAVLQCANKATPFTTSDSLSLELIALIAGHTLHKLELFDSAMSAGRRTSAILQVVKAVADENHDTHGMILRVIQVAKTALNCDRLTLYLCNRVRRELVCCVCRDSMVEQFCLPYDKGLAGHVASTGKLVRITNCYDDPRFLPDVDVKSGYKSVSMLCAPVISADGDTIAVLQAMNKSSWPIPANYTGTIPPASITAFQDGDVTLMHEFCTELAGSLRKSTLEVLYHNVYTDMNRTKRRDSVSLVVSSLLGVHSNDKAMRPSVKGWKISGLVTLAATKFMKSLAKRKNEPRVDVAASVGRGSDGRSSSHDSLHVVPPEWRAKHHGFDDFTFNIFHYTHDQLAVLVVQGFSQMGLCSIFSIPDDIAVNFVETVRRGYHDNPYHSWWHAADVFQHVFALLNRTTLLTMLQPNIVFAMLVAGLCHDIGHPGTDNAYEIATGSALAIQYNDMSVLEQHHACETFRILQRPSCNILLGMSKPAHQTMRKLVIDGILQTDMKCHFDLVHDLEDAVARRQKGAGIFDLSNVSHVKWLTGAILHASDIGAQTYPVAIAGQWSQRLVDEFRLLGEKEQSKGLPVAPFRDNLTTNKAVGRLQLNFINYIVTPIWHLVMDILPDAAVLRVNLDANRTHYQNLILEDMPNMASCGGSGRLLATTSSMSSLTKLDLHQSNSTDSDIVRDQQLQHKLSMSMASSSSHRQLVESHSNDKQASNSSLRRLHTTLSQNADLGIPHHHAPRPTSASKTSLHRPPSMTRIPSSTRSSQAGSRVEVEPPKDAPEMPA